MNSLSIDRAESLYLALDLLFPNLSSNNRFLAVRIEHALPAIAPAAAEVLGHATPFQQSKSFAARKAIAGKIRDIDSNDYLSFILTGTGGTVQIAHGPPSTQNFLSESNGSTLRHEVNSNRTYTGTYQLPDD